MKCFLLRGLFALAICALPASVFAQATGRISGTVTDQNGQPLKGIKITAKSPTQIGGSRTVYSNDEGSFTIANLMPGNFEVIAQSQGLRSWKAADVLVGINAPVEVYPIMEVETQEVTEVIEAKQPVVNASSAALVQKYDADFVDKLPVPDRFGHAGMLQNLPGVTGQNVRGGTATQNVFMLEGFTTNSLGGGSGQIIPQNSLAALEIQTGGYGAENAQAAGSVMNMVTKSGSNRYEVDVRTDHEDSTLRFFLDDLDNKDQRTWSNRTSATISGPIVKDRLWFFSLFEFRSNVASRGKDPTGIRPDPPRRSDLSFRGLGKLTWQVSQRNKLTFVFNGNRDFFKNGQDGFQYDRDAQWMMDNFDIFSGLIYDAVLADNVLFRSQVGVQQFQQDFGPELCRRDPVNCDHVNPLRQNVPTFYEFNNWNTHRFTVSRSFEFKNSLEWFAENKKLGSHSIKLTGRYYGTYYERKETTPGDYIIVYNGLQPFQRRELFVNDPRTQEARTGWAINSGTSSLIQLSLQDSFKLPSYRFLTITPGVGFMMGSAENTAGRTILDFAAATPHISAAWDATQDGRTVVRASFNHYLDPGTSAVTSFLDAARTVRFCNYIPGSNPPVIDFSTCGFSGGAANRTVGQPCGPDGLNPDGTRCDQKLTTPRTWEYTAGVEREVVQGVALGADFVYRRYDRPYEDFETNRIWDRAGTALEPTGQYRNGRNFTVFDLETPSGAQRRYMGVTTQIKKREGNVKVLAAYTWQRLEGNVGDGVQNAWGTNPGQDIYQYGYLGGDRRHEIKAQATWAVTPWLSLGTVYAYTSGGPYQRYFRNDIDADFSHLRARRGYSPGNNLNDPLDDRELRLPDIQAVNLNTTVNVGQLLKSKANIEAYADVLNLLALRTTTSLVETDGPTWSQPQGRLDPFRLRIGLRFRY